MRAPPKRVLVTGSAGFLGRYISGWFRGQGAAVTEVVRSKRDLPLPEEGPVATTSGRGSVIRVTVPAEITWEALLRETQPEVVVHCAGSASVQDSMLEPGADFEAGPALTFSILNAMRTDVTGSRFVFLSSAAVYGNPWASPILEEHTPRPLSPYGFHKWQSELICREFFEMYGIPTAILRVFSAYGAGLRRQVVWDICQKALRGQSFTLHGTGRETRDFVHASDVAQAVAVVAASASMQGETYNVGTGVETTIAEIAATLLRLVPGAADLSVSFNGAVTPGNPVNWRADVGRVAALGFRSHVGLEAGLKSVATWCHQQQCLQ